MYSFKKSLAALAGLLVIAAAVALLPHAGLGQGDAKNPLKRDARRSYYLTQTTRHGNEALTACAAGYHMASLWEIFDTSNLRYDTELGLTTPDSGFGPPNLIAGWIRTGRPGNSAGANPGLATCLDWTSDSNEQEGTRVHLSGSWDSIDVTLISPWVAAATPCDLNVRVWCVQD